MGYGDKNLDKKEIKQEGGDKRGSARSRHIQKTTDRQIQPNIRHEESTLSMESNAWGQQQLSVLRTHLGITERSKTSSQDNIQGEATQLRSMSAAHQQRAIGELTKQQVMEHEIYWEAEFKIEAPPSSGASELHRWVVEKEGDKNIRESEEGLSTLEAKKEEGQRKRKATEITDDRIENSPKRARKGQDSDNDLSIDTYDKMNKNYTNDNKKSSEEKINELTLQQEDNENQQKESLLNKRLKQAYKYKKDLNRYKEFHEQIAEDIEQMGYKLYRQYISQESQILEELGEHKYRQYREQEGQFRESIGEDSYRQYRDQRILIRQERNQRRKQVIEIYERRYQRDWQQIPQIVQKRFQQDLEAAPRLQDQLQQVLDRRAIDFNEERLQILQQTPENLRSQRDQELQQTETKVRGELQWKFATDFYDTQLRGQFQERLGILLTEIDRRFQQKLNRLKDQTPKKLRPISSTRSNPD